MASYIWSPTGPNGVPVFNTLSSLPAATSTPAGTLAVTADSGTLYESNGTIWQAIAQPGGGGSGASTALDNLTSVAINAQLIFGSGVAGIFETADAPGNTQNMFVLSGSSTVAGTSGSSSVGSGSTVTGNSGDVSVVSGAVTVAGISGDASLGSGPCVSGSPSGNANVFSGDNSGGNSGNVILKTGAASGFRGAIIFDDNSLGPAANGYVWTLADQPSGVGGWAPLFPAATDVSLLQNDGAGTLSWVTGASGSFLSADAKTVTVTNGIITSIV